MDMTKRILERVEKISKLLEEVKEDLASIEEESKRKPPRRTSRTEVIPGDEEMKNLYELFYEDFVQNRRDEIAKAIEQKSKKFLAVFCKVNNLPIDGAKASKKRITEEVLNWLSQRKAITSEVR
jgi:hypothetical protein